VIILYGAAQVPFTEKVRRALLYKKLEFQLREPRSEADYKRWSPNGQLPALEIDGERTADSTAILMHLDALHPEPPLLSRDVKVAEQQRQLEDWTDASFIYYYTRWFGMQEVPLPLKVEDDASRVRPTSPVPERGLGPSSRRLLAWLKAGGTWERPETALVRGLGDRLGDLVNFLGGRQYFYADQLSIADLGVYSMLRFMTADVIPGSARLLTSRSTLLDFMRRVEAETGG
jgi:glutathione S-transferase